MSMCAAAVIVTRYLSKPMDRHHRLLCLLRLPILLHSQARTPVHLDTAIVTISRLTLEHEAHPGHPHPQAHITHLTPVPDPLTRTHTRTRTRIRSHPYHPYLLCHQRYRGRRQKSSLRVRAGDVRLRHRCRCILFLHRHHHHL